MRVINTSSRNKIFVFSIVCIIVGIYIFGNIKHNFYHDVYLLPICYGVFLHFIAKIFSILKKYVVFWIITVQQIARYLILPILFTTDENSFSGSLTYNEGVAVSLMIIELIVVLIMYYFVSSKENFLKDRKVRFLKINFLNSAILVIFIFVILSNQAFLNKLSFVWDFSYYLEIKDDELQDISPVVSILFPLMRGYIILYLFAIINSFKIKKGKKLVLSLLILLLNATIIIGVSRFSIVYATIPLIVVLIYLYPSYKKRISVLSLVFSIFILLISSVTKFTTDRNDVNAESFLTINQLNAYFGGVANYAVGYDSYLKSNVQPSDHLKYLLSDITQNIPFISKFSSAEYKSAAKFNYEIYSNNRNYDQIVPISISGIYHFSTYFFYIYIVVLVLLAFKFERKAYASENSIIFFLYIILAVACSTFMMINIGSVSASFCINLLVIIPSVKILQLVSKQQ